MLYYNNTIILLIANRSRNTILLIYDIINKFNTFLYIYTLLISLFAFRQLVYTNTILYTLPSLIIYYIYAFLLFQLLLDFYLSNSISPDLLNLVCL